MTDERIRVLYKGSMSIREFARAIEFEVREECAKVAEEVGHSKVRESESMGAFVAAKAIREGKP